MAVTFSLPSDIESHLRKTNPKLDEGAREAFVVAQYRAGQISTGDVAKILGFATRHEAERWLGLRGVSSGYSLEDLDSDRATLDRVLGNVRP